MKLMPSMICRLIIFSFLAFTSANSLDLEEETLLPPTFASKQSFKAVRRVLNVEESSILCDVSTLSNYAIKWYKDGSQMVSFDHERQIKFTGIQINSSGLYWCTAANQKGVARSQVYNVSVAFVRDSSNCPKEKSVLKKPLESLWVEKVVVSANPPVKNSWEFINESNTKTLMKEGKRVYIAVNGDLYIGYLRREDNGKRIKYSYSASDRKTGCMNVNLTIQGEESATFTPSLLYKSPENVVGLLGGSVDIECFVSSSPHRTSSLMSWQREGSSSHPFNPEYSPNRWRMRLDDLKSSDAAVYVCSFEDVTARTTLIVQEHPSFTSHPSDTNATEGDNLRIPCAVTSSPPAEVMWFINDKPVSENEPRLSLSKDKMEMMVRGLCRGCGGSRLGDSMVVRCEAANKWGAVQASGYINVLKRTKVTLHSSNSVFEVDTPNSEASVVFECGVEADAMTPVEVRWSYFVSEDHYGETLVSDGVGMQVKGSMLSFHVTNNSSKNWKDYSGKYVCSAGNGYSNDEVYVYVRVLHISRALATLTRNWWLLMLAAIFLLFLLIFLALYCAYQIYNKEISYYVDKFERQNGNDPVKELEEAQFKDYTRQDLKGSKHTLCSANEDDDEDDDDDDDPGRR